jgi:hypothetical protein
MGCSKHCKNFAGLPDGMPECRGRAPVVPRGSGRPFDYTAQLETRGVRSPCSKISTA